jgi:hypothetical protein
MGKEILVQCYKVEDGKLFIGKMNKTEMKRYRYFESPLEAIDDILDTHKYWLRDQEYKLKKRKEVISKLEEIRNKYINCEDIFPKDDSDFVNIYNGINY